MLRLNTFVYAQDKPSLNVSVSILIWVSLFRFLKVHSVAWNCIGTKLASGSVDQTARIWHIEPHGHVSLILKPSKFIHFSFPLTFCYNWLVFVMEIISPFHFHGLGETKAICISLRHRLVFLFVLSEDDLWDNTVE